MIAQRKIAEAREQAKELISKATAEALEEAGEVARKKLMVQEATDQLKQHRKILSSTNSLPVGTSADLAASMQSAPSSGRVQRASSFTITSPENHTEVPRRSSRAKIRTKFFQSPKQMKQ